MADERRHAAWQHERSFAVRLLPEEGDPVELADGLGDFLDAVDFAVDWVSREDPDRKGTAGLAIFETRAGETEQVWAYPPGSFDGRPLMKIFGFDPVNWKSGSVEFAPRPKNGTFFSRPTTKREQETAAPEPLREPVAASEPPQQPVVAPEPPLQRPTAPEPPRERVVAPEPPPLVVAAAAPPVPVSLPPAPRIRPSAPPPAAVFSVHDDRDDEADRPPGRQGHIDARRALAAAWEDRVSRACLVLAALTLWLSLALTDAGLLVLLLVALSGLWWRRDKLTGAARTDVDDWV